MQSLSHWAKDNKKTYNQAYREFMRGNISNAKKLENGSIVIENNNNPVVSSPIVTNTSFTPKSIGFDSNMVKASTKTRSNRSSIIQPVDRFGNIDQVFIPFRADSQIADYSTLSIRDVLTLCMKAYFGYAIVRNVVETFAHFCASPIYFTGGSEKSRKFFDAYFKKIKLQSFTLQFFKEFWRSQNCFIFKHLGALKEDSIKEITQVFGAEVSKAAKYKIPIKYTILNPIDIEAKGSSSLVNPIYTKKISSYELECLKNPKTDQDKEILDSLDPKVKEQIKSGKTSSITIELDPKLVRPVFNGKMDYESFAVPMIYSLLDSLESKTQLMKMDQAIAKTCQQAILLITHGYEDKAGGYNYSQKVTDALESIFQNESVGRVLVCDFTTKAEFVLPQIGEILDPKKYEIIQRDLEEGLGHILFGGGSSGEKFSNQHAKIQIFIEKLRSAREIFLNEFLIDEIKQISQELGFKNFPTPHFQDIDLEDSNEFKRIVTQLAQFGFLTPAEVFEALQTHRLPTQEESEVSQATYRQSRDKGLYEPIAGGPFTQEKVAKETAKEIEGPVGRPSGSKSPQGVKTVSPIGTGSSFSLSKIKDNLILSAKLSDEIVNKIKKKFKIKTLNDEQTNLVDELTNVIISHEKPTEWNTKIDDYMLGSSKEDPKKLQEINQICEEYKVNKFLGAILLNSNK